jgi:hypothetical protein
MSGEQTIPVPVGNPTPVVVPVASHFTEQSVFHKTELTLL